MRPLVALALCVVASGCTLMSHSNRELKIEPPPPSRASLEIDGERGNDRTLVFLALSGGGSRAAYFSARVMLRLQELFPDVDLLKEVDVISSVSGGGLPAAYYCLSSDPGDNVSVRVFSDPDTSKVPERTQLKLSYDPQRRLLGFAGPMLEGEYGWLKTLYPETDDRNQAKVRRLFELTPQQVKSTRPWRKESVERAMKKNYQRRWFLNWFWPQNIALYWTTAYDRSDIMAQTFADNLFDAPFQWEYLFAPWHWGTDFKFRDLNRERPFLILNATDSTETKRGEVHFGEPFTFTREEFADRIHSDIGNYPVAHGVMASAAFPAVFSYVTLRDYRPGHKEGRKEFLHTFDGGNYDNLGLQTVRRLAEPLRDRYSRIAVILVDSFVMPRGVDRHDADPKSRFLIDWNLLSSFDILLKTKRDTELSEFKAWADRSGILLCHLTFEDIAGLDPELKNELDTIPTNFKSNPQDRDAIDRAVDILLAPNNPPPSMVAIRDMVKE